jgi:hypothetical protein
MVRSMYVHPPTQRTTFVIGACTSGHLFALEELLLGEQLRGADVQIAVEKNHPEPRQA